jgi:RNA-directed DNA polymerase
MSLLKFPANSLPELATLLNTSEHDLLRLAKNAGKSYIRWEVPKPSGGKRSLTTPKAELKSLQRELHKKIMSKLDFGPFSHYGQKRKSSITNARAHRGSKVIFTYDLKSFFPSVRPSRVCQALINEVACPDQVANLITKLVTVDHQLPQGAPTSTDIANIVTLRLQRRLYGLLRQWGLKAGKFTIYADDITLSASLIPDGFQAMFKKVIKEEGYKVHPKKHGIYDKSKSQIITGVNIGHGASVGKIKKNWRAEHHQNTIKFSKGEISIEEFKASERKYGSRKIYANSVKKIASLSQK